MYIHYIYTSGNYTQFKTKKYELVISNAGLK